MAEGSWPEVTIRGGVHGHNTIVEIDGKRVERTTRVEVVFDVHDAVRMTTYQLVKATIRAQYHPGLHTKVWTAQVEQVWTEDDPDGKTWADSADVYQQVRREIVAEATADTDWQALADCAKQLELKAKQAARAGT